MLTIGFGYIPRMPAADCVALARHGEALGFDSCWVADQTFYYDPFALLGAIASATSRIEVGLAVTNPFSRHPAQLARSAHALADLSDGRFTLGIGAGNRKELLDKLSIEQNKTPARTQAATEIIRALLQGKQVNRSDPPFPMAEIELESPLSRKVPLLVGARGPRMLRMAGGTGDGAIVECLLTPHAVDWAKEQLAAGAADHGRALEDLRYIAWGVGLVVNHFEEVPRAIRNMVGHLIAVMPERVIRLLELDVDKMERMKVDYAEGGPAAAGPYIGEAELSAVTFVGRPETLQRKFQTLAGRGVDHISMLLMGQSLAENKRTLESFAEHMLPSA